MDEFEVILTQQAKKGIRNLDRREQNQIVDRLEWLGGNVLDVQHHPLKGEKWKGLYKYRVGQYRIIYALDIPKRQITILKVGHRRDVYK